MAAIYSILPSEPTTYGQWLQVKAMMAPFSPIASLRLMDSPPIAGLAFGSSNCGAASPGSIPLGPGMSRREDGKQFNSLPAVLYWVAPQCLCIPLACGEPSGVLDQHRVPFSKPLQRLYSQLSHVVLQQS